MKWNRTWTSTNQKNYFFGGRDRRGRRLQAPTIRRIVATSIAVIEVRGDEAKRKREGRGRRRVEIGAGVGKRRQLARVYTTALCSRRPHREQSLEPGKVNVSICPNTSFPLFPIDCLTVLQPSSRSLSLSLSFFLLSLCFYHSRTLGTSIMTRSDPGEPG